MCKGVAASTGIEVNIKNHEHHYPAMSAYKNNHIECCKMIKEKGGLLFDIARYSE